MASKKHYLDTSVTSAVRVVRNKDLEKIANAGDEITMPAGSLIVDQGQTGREAFIVLEAGHGEAQRQEDRLARPRHRGR